MVKPSNGLVISYNYLWAREYDRHEESGRKARPACVQIIIARNESATIVALFPITSQPPYKDRTALQIPEMEARRIGLTIPSWIILDEWNLDNLAKSPQNCRFASARRAEPCLYEKSPSRSGRSHSRSSLPVYPSSIMTTLHAKDL
jgi:hypothetical protein